MAVDQRLLGVIGVALSEARDQQLHDVATIVHVGDAVTAWLGEQDEAPPLPWLRPTPAQLRQHQPHLRGGLAPDWWLCPVAGCGQMVAAAERDQHARDHFG